MSKSPLASIVVITYNQEKTLSSTLDSLLKQKTSFSYEIVVGEDCSTDGTRKVLSEYAYRYPNVIHPIYNEINKGVLENYISVLSHCKGKYIAACAGDDYWIDEEKLQMQVDVMEQYSNVGVVYTDYLVDSVATNEQFRRECSDPQENVFSQLLVGCFMSAPTVCFRSELIKHVNFNEFVRLGFAMEDYPMWLTFSLYTDFYHIKRYTATYRIERKFINDAKEVSMHACKFDECSTAIRLYYIRKYSDRTNMTENEILDAHYKLCYLAGLNMNDRKFTLSYVSKIANRTPYLRRLNRICKSNLLFAIYQCYRTLTGKTRTPLQMYFGM